MDERIFPLTQDRQRLLAIRRTPDSGSVYLRRVAGSVRSPIDRALENHLLVRLDEGIHRFSESPHGVIWPHPVHLLQITLGSREPFLLYEERDGESAELAYSLSPFESRFLAENGYPHPSPGLGGAEGVQLATDLHSHFAGCVVAEDLIRLAEEGNVTYPGSILFELGLDPDRTGQRPIRELPAHTKAALASRLRIPLDRQIPFVEMSAIYRRRAPFTKNLALLPALLKTIAADYREMGVTYAELSLFNVLEEECLAIIHRELPRIEEESGVRLRFLAALSRHDDPEWDLDCLDRLEQLSGSEFIAGVDFMGHETNSTRTFAPQLKEIATRMAKVRPGFAIRVHAGENPAHPENIRAAVESTAGHDVQLRIGHGLYGADEETLDLLRKAGAIVEFNLNSNFALNNVQSSLDVPLHHYLDAGIDVVLGTDGYGIYSTKLGYEVQAARLCGASDDELAQIRQTEERYLKRRLENDARHTVPSFTVPPAQPPRRYTPEIIERKEQRQLTMGRALRSRLAELGVPIVEGESFRELLRDRQCISFAGAWRRSWQELTDDMRAHVEETIRQLLDSWNPSQTALVAGGTRDGVEGIVQREAIGRGFTVIGTVVEETPPDSLAAGHMTHAAIISSSLYDKAAALYELIKSRDGLCLFIGGGSIVGDEIQTAANLRLRYLLMDGPAGASTAHARQQPGRSFKNAQEAIDRLSSMHSWRSSAEPYWQTGPNPTVDLLVLREKSLLLVRRSDKAQDEPGRWALPGGFQLTDAPRNTPWQPGKETASEACLRELHEETGLALQHLEPRLEVIGVYEGGGRDPRDTPFSWSRTTAFALRLSSDEVTLDPTAGEDAEEARWWPLAELPEPLAFDHATIIDDYLRRADNARRPSGMKA